MSTVLHEAEVQRQHTRYRIPMQCEVRGSSRDVVDWSVSGLAIDAPSGEFKHGTLEPLTVTFPIADYSIAMKMDAEVRYIDAQKGRVGLKFVNATRRQLDVLRYFIDAYLSGEIVDARDVIEVSARRNEAQARATPAVEAPKTIGGKMSRLAGQVGRMSVAVGAGVTLVALVGTSLYERLMVVPATSAIVTTDLVTLPASLGGSVAFVAPGETIKRGEPLAGVETIDGKSMVVSSPCDCAIQTRYAAIGDFVTQGSPLISLRRHDAKPFVTAFVPRDQIMRIYDGARARIVLTNGLEITDTHIRVVPANEQNAAAPGSNELVKVIVEFPQTPEMNKRIGEPAKVFFESDVLRSLPAVFRT